MTKSEEDKMSFVCTDRFGETKTFELNLNTSTDKKIYNQQLIEKLKEFQNNVNSLMTEFVNKEKDILKESESSRVKTSKDKKDGSDEDDDEEGEDDETDEDQKEIKLENAEKRSNESEILKKRQNGDGINTDIDAKKQCLSD